VAGVVLAGGRSRRMGVSKATLDWRGERLVCRVSSRLAAVVEGPVVVVRAPGQPLPDLPHGVGLTQDAHPDRGPLEGLAAGMRAVAGEADVVFVSTVDAPLLRPELVRLLLGALEPGDEIAAPSVAGQSYPLTAAWRLSTLQAVETALTADRLRVRDLLDACATRLVTELDLRAVDPELESLLNLNDPGAYAAALARAVE